MVRKLQSKMNEETEHKFNLVRVIKAHLLPITNVAFNKLSTLFATGTSNIYSTFVKYQHCFQVHMIEHAKYSKLPREKSFFHWRVTKMLFIL